MFATPSSKKSSPTGKKRLLDFLRELLADESNRDVIIWTDKSKLEFRMIKPHEVALRWGAATGNSSMNYDKMSRGLRYFYTNNTLEKIPGKDSRYRFLSGNSSETPSSASSSPPQTFQPLSGLVDFSALSGLSAALSARNFPNFLSPTMVPNPPPTARTNNFNISRFLENLENSDSSPQSSPPSITSSSSPGAPSTSPVSSRSPNATSSTPLAPNPFITQFLFQFYMSFPHLIPKIN